MSSSERERKIHETHDPAPHRCSPVVCWFSSRHGCRGKPKPLREHQGRGQATLLQSGHDTASFRVRTDQECCSQSRVQSSSPEMIVTVQS